MKTQPLQILLVENDKHDYRLIKRTLDAWELHCEINWEQHGQEAINWLQTKAVDLVLLDLNLPGMDGLAVFQKMKELNLDVPTIFVTGSGSEYTAVQAMKLGADDYLVKDVTGEYLQLLPIIIQQIIKRRQSEQTRFELEQELAVERQHNLEQLEQRAALAEIELAISQIDKLDVVLQRIVQKADELLASTGGVSIILWDEETESFTVSNSTIPGQSPQYAASHARSKRGVTRRIIDTLKPVILSDIHQDQEPPNPMLLEWNIKAFMGIPLLHDNIALGVLYTMDNYHRAYTQVEIDSLTSLAQWAAVTIVKVRLYDGLIEANEKLTWQQEQLQKQVQLLNEQNEELDAFSHSVAHDLKSPLALISGYAELMETIIDEEGYQDLAEYVQIIFGTSQKMADIIDALLLLASVRRQDVLISKFEMLPIVKDVLVRLDSLMQEADTILHLPASWQPALGYAPWVEEIWANYISNAIKYGGLPPRIQLGSTVQKNSMVRYWVKDNGRGLTAEEQDMLFTPFTQLGDKGKGHGLGLSIVKRIAARCNGRVGIDSTLGEGSTFWFELPAAESGLEVNTFSIDESV